MLADYGARDCLRVVLLCAVLLVGTFGIHLCGVPSAQGQSLNVDGDPTLVIDTATPGQQPDPVDDQSTNISWSNLDLKSKVTISTSCPGQTFSLTAEAINVTNGTSMGAVTLEDGMAETDFVRDISPIENGGATLYYHAEATVGDGVGTDQHSVTFTLTAQ